MKKIILYVIYGICAGVCVFGIFKLIEYRTNMPYQEEFSEVIVESPQMNSRIQSPMVVRGKAKGYWFFEASFPIILENKHGDIIASGIAQAGGEWMTEQYVPFSSELIFPKQKGGEEGLLIFKKDNPSGLPEHDASVSIPITF